MKTIEAVRRHARHTRLHVTLLLMLALVLTGRDSGRQDALQAQTAPGCPAYPNNPVACENELAGDTDWDISGAGDFSIQGFASDMSVNVGQRVNFKIDTPSDNYRVDIYRLGYYGGAGARKLATQTITGEQNQPSCATDPVPSSPGTSTCSSRAARWPTRRSPGGSSRPTPAPPSAP